MSAARARLRWVRELAVVTALAVVVEVGLRVTTLPRLARLLRVRLDLDEHGAVLDEVPVLPGWARRPARATAVVLSRRPFQDTCLRRCLVLGSRIRGLDPVLRIGVRRSGTGGWEAHSWLEVGGRSLDPSREDYSTFGRS
ncbi:lasso peptide biosynthesis B2 protein [Jannaschia sp. R86511]|uniref:lasso peptide biosynthesis B2 protein n=1 Tax=Jannaschia sp. R86511 TaxID=3093853 RepID=UPI0036D33353